MDSYQILILLCCLVIFSYLFDLVAKRTRLPSVLLLLLLGIGIRALADSTGVRTFDVQLLLATLGNIGLILIVFEGSLELSYEHEKRSIISKAFLSSFFILLLTTFAIAGILYYITGADWLPCFANAVPLSVISSAVAIPSAGGLTPSKKEFVVYESSFSDILGIVFFNFLVSNDTFGVKAFAGLGGEIVSVLFLSAVFSMALLWLLGRITHKVKFFLILAILVLVYAVGKQIHLSSLVVVVAFGMFMANAEKMPFPWFRQRFLYGEFPRDLEQFHSLSRESAFLIRTLFFVLFGFSVVIGQLLVIDITIIAAIMLVATYAIRALFLKVAVNMDLQPLVYMTPRGLISILLYFSLPAHLLIPEVNTGLLFLVVLGSCLIMAIGLISSRRTTVDMRKAQASTKFQEKASAQEEAKPLLP